MCLMEFCLSIQDTPSGKLSLPVTPAQAGAQLCFNSGHKGSWVPAFAGMTEWGGQEWRDELGLTLAPTCEGFSSFMWGGPCI
jgi:hypothetical protein